MTIRIKKLGRLGACCLGSALLFLACGSTNGGSGAAAGAGGGIGGIGGTGGTGGTGGMGGTTGGTGGTTCTPQSPIIIDSIGEAGDVGAYNSLGLDAAGGVHISYCGSSPWALRYVVVCP